jgi:hypothetical protein
MGAVYRGATVNRHINEAVHAWLAGHHARASELLRFAATHSSTPTRMRVFRLCNVLAADAVEPTAEESYRRVAALCQ